MKALAVWLASSLCTAAAKAGKAWRRSNLGKKGQNVGPCFPAEFGPVLCCYLLPQHFLPIHATSRAELSNMGITQPLTLRLRSFAKKLCIVKLWGSAVGIEDQSLTRIGRGACARMQNGWWLRCHGHWNAKVDPYPWELRFQLFFGKLESMLMTTS